jgi:hypothetical protein
LCTLRKKFKNFFKNSKFKNARKNEKKRDFKSFEFSKLFSRKKF